MMFAFFLLLFVVRFWGLVYSVFEFCIAFGLSALDTFVLCHVRLKGTSLTTHTHLKYVHVHVDPGIYALPMSVCECWNGGG